MSIKILEYKEINKGALQGSCTVFVEKWGVEIRSVMIFRKGNQRWAAMPSREFEADGEKRYYNLVMFPNKDHMTAFSGKVIAALDEYLAVQPPLPADPVSQSNGCPF